MARTKQLMPPELIDALHQAVAAGFTPAQIAAVVAVAAAATEASWSIEDGRVLVAKSREAAKVIHGELFPAQPQAPPPTPRSPEREKERQRTAV